MSELHRLAWEAREAAYAPYSGYKVGAAVRATDGREWSGCNVENLAYGSTMCAERNAVFQMVRDGALELAEVVVATRDGGTPCGACLQVLWEFAPEPNNVQVTMLSEVGEAVSYMLSDLLPHGFRSGDVGRTER